jgi:hypothetical protein
MAKNLSANGGAGGQDEWNKIVARMSPEERAATKYMVDHGGEVTEAEVVQHLRDNGHEDVSPGSLEKYGFVDPHRRGNAPTKWKVKPALRDPLRKALENAGV